MPSTCGECRHWRVRAGWAPAHGLGECAVRRMVVQYEGGEPQPAPLSRRATCEACDKFVRREGK